MKTNKKTINPKTIAAAATLAAMQIGAAYAQANDALKLDEMVITASPEGRSKMKQSQSISTLDSEQITNTVANGTGDILRTIPGVRSETGSGEGNANVTVRGVPISAGGARYVQFQEDGLPVMMLGDFNFVTADMFMRTGMGTDGLEVVRGGSASTMATNSPGGVINFISKTGETAGGSVSVTTNIGGADSKRYDFGYGKPTSDTSSFHISGFIRDGEGPRKTDGVKMEQGGQLKATFSKDLGGGNNMKLFAKFLDDKTPIMAGVPVNVVNGQIQQIPNIDPRTFSPNSSKLPTVNGWGINNTSVGLNDGLTAKSTSIGAEVNLNLGDGWKVSDKFRISQNSGSFSGIMPASYPTPNLGTSYTALLFGAKFNDVGMAVNDLKATKTHALSDGAKLTTTGGLMMASQKYNTDWEIGGFDSTLPATTFGSYTSWYKKAVNETFNTMSPYAAASWEKDKLIIDASVRSDRQTVTGSFIDNAAKKPDNSLAGNRGVDYTSSINSYSIGANYSIDKNTAVFARVSEGGSFQSDRPLTPDSYKTCGATCFTGNTMPANKVTQYETGVKWREGNLSTFVTLFQAKTDESNYDLTTGKSSSNKYDAKGVELEAGYKVGAFRLNGGLTFTNATVTGSNDAAYVGKTPNRQARYIYQLSPSYKFGNTTAGLAIIGTTSSKDAQLSAYEATMPGYTYANAFINHDIDKSTVVSLGVNNLTNTLGYTENNSERAAARAITGRTVKATLRYNF